MPAVGGERKVRIVSTMTKLYATIVSVMVQHADGTTAPCRIVTDAKPTFGGLMNIASATFAAMVYMNNEPVPNATERGFFTRSATVSRAAKLQRRTWYGKNPVVPVGRKSPVLLDQIVLTCGQSKAYIARFGDAGRVEIDLLQALLCKSYGIQQ